MSLVTSSILLMDARKKGTCVPAFNVCNYETVKAVISACEKVKRNAIIQVSEGALSYIDVDVIVAIVKALTKNTLQGYALHLDHGKSYEMCKKVVDAGFTSVMIDGSLLSMEENIKLTKKVVAYAHKKGVSVEAELGEILGKEDNHTSTNLRYTDPMQAKLFAEKTKCDSLALSIGTAHGINKSSTMPVIQYEIIKKTLELLPDVPLVAHGCSTVPKSLINTINQNGGNINDSQGINEKDLTKMSTSGINKINIDSDLRLAFTSAVREILMDKPQTTDPRTYLKYAITIMSEHIVHLLTKVIK
ncbi:MAG: class II fructose-bisphosphate aldolase [Clostridia bacterium]